MNKQTMTRAVVIVGLLALNAILFSSRPAEADDPGYFLDCHHKGTPAAFCDYYPFRHCTSATCVPTEQ